MRVGAAERAADRDPVCVTCGKVTDNLAGDPGQWALYLPAGNGSGILAPWHYECASLALEDAKRYRWLRKDQHEVGSWPSFLPPDKFDQWVDEVRLSSPRDAE